MAKVIDGVAAAALGGAVAFAALQFAGAVVALSASLAIFAVSWKFLQSLPAGSATFHLPKFAPAELVGAESLDELLLTAEMVVLCAAEPEPDELLLDDVVKAVGVDPKIVPLFDRAKVPSAGELHRNIDRHLESRTSGMPDASAELSDALAELRRSLR